MRRFAAITTLVALLFAAGCSEPGSGVVDGEGILGTYTVNGVDVRGEEYSGTVVIEATDVTDEYVIQWLVSGAIQQGVGVLTGDRFEATWETVSSGSGDATGTASYTVADNGDFTGTRTIDGVDGVGTEEIFVEA